MTLGHSNRASIANAAVARALARAQGTWGGFQAWGQLDAEKRLELIEQVLAQAANDPDGFPLAL